MQGRIISAVAILGAVSILVGAFWVVTRTGSETDERESLATLSGVFNEVSTLQAGHLTWEPGHAGASLRLRDSVRTAGGARATVAYRSGLVLNVDPDSLLVITAPRVDERGSQVQEVLVASGAVRGEVTAGAGGPGRRVVEIVRETGEVAARLTSTGGEALRYRVRHSDDDTTEVAILSGSAEVESGEERVELSAGQAVEVSRTETGGSAVSAAVRLPPFPASVAPDVDAQLSLEEHPARVPLSWRSDEGVSSHRVQVARGFAFEEIVEDQLVEGDSYAFEPKVAGTYFWRVAGRDQRGREGEFGYVRRFSVLSLPGEPEPEVEPRVEDLDEMDLDPISEPPPVVATEQEFDFAGRVTGQGLRRQARGRGTFRPISGRVQLNAQDVLHAERWSSVRLGRDATLQLDADTRLELSRAGREGGRRVLAVTLDEGGLVTDLGERSALASVLVEADGDRVTIRSEEGGARVRTTRMDDRLRIVAERGDASIWTGGREHTVAAGHALDKPADGGEPRVLTLPENPRQAEPEAGARFMTLDSPPEIVFSWQPVDEAVAYRVRILSGGRQFFQGMSRSPRLVHTALPPGEYQWRIHAISDEGLESLDPRQRAFSVVRDDRPPEITVISPADGLTTEDERVTVSGTTEPDVRVKVNGRDVDLEAGGRFETEVSLTPGVNQIVIEAVNRANAVTFRSLRVRRE